MCTGYEIAALAVAAAGTKMQMDAQADSEERQQRAMANALETQDNFSRQAEQKALANSDEYDPTKRVERFEEARQAAGDSLAKQLTQAREASPSISQAKGRLSKEFEAASAKADADQYQQSADMARLFGNMRGSQDMLTREGYTNADYAAQLGQIGRAAQGAYQAAQPGISAAGRPNSGAMLAGGLMQGSGTSVLTSSLGKRMASVSNGGVFGTGTVRN